MILAAVDTSHARGSLVVALLENSAWKTLAKSAWDKKAMHSEVATLEFDRAVRSAGLRLTDLTHLAVNVGPGSFTGLRVGINLTRTLAYAFGLPIAPLSTLEILASREARAQKSFVAVKALQNFYYVAAFENEKELLPPQSMEERSLAQASSGYTKVLIEGTSPGFSPWTEAGDMLPLLARSDDRRRFFSWSEIKPLYVRASEAEEKLKKGLLKPI